MTKQDKTVLDGKILKFVKARGSTNVQSVARHLKIKWDTANRGLKRLQSKGEIFYYPDMKLWSIFNDRFFKRHVEDGQISENGNEMENQTNSTLDISLSPQGIVRGGVGEVVQKGGFVCHPLTKGSEVPREFIRGHIKGQYLVEINEVGRMPESFVLNNGTTGGWVVRKMTGNSCYYGHLNIPDDAKPFKFHSMANKDGTLRKLSVYVHPRYIYYKDNSFYAPIEFRQQVRDILTVLEGYGWKFGAVNQRGIYHMAINDPVLASYVPNDHVEHEDDAVHYDSSVKDGEGVCTEAEVYDDHDSAVTEMEVMVELPSRIIGIQSRISDLTARMINVEKGLVVITGALEKNVDNTEHIMTAITDLSKLTEFNTAVLIGNPVPIQETGFSKSKEGPMYG